MENANFVEIKQKICTAINLHNMLDDCRAIVVGVSGGADSMCLLHFLQSFCQPLNISIIAAHVNHLLRGQESDHDEELLRAFCERSNTELHVLHVDAKMRSKASGLGIEECSRIIRYDFFNQVARAHGGTGVKLATAHTLSDSLETAIFNMVRGSGLAGIGGIPAVRGNIIRPLIALKSCDTRSYCHGHGIEYAIDSSNLQMDYSRNKIRLGVIPLLAEINPALEEVFFRLSVLVRRDMKYLDDEANDKLESACLPFDGYDVLKLSALPVAILSRCVLSATHEALSIKLQEVHVRLICRAIYENCGKVNLPGGHFATVRAGRLRFTCRKLHCLDDSADLPGFEVPITCDINTHHYLGRYITQVISKEEFYLKLKFNNLLLNNAIDCDTITVGTKLRSRASGDTFSPAGRNVTKLLRKFFNEMKVPPAARDKLLLIACGSEVLWVEGFGVSSRAVVTDNTKKVILIRVEDNEVV